jgi:hypothetical protein
MLADTATAGREVVRVGEQCKTGSLASMMAGVVVARLQGNPAVSALLLKRFFPLNHLGQRGISPLSLAREEEGWGTQGQ